MRQPGHERHDIRQPEDTGHVRRALRRLAEANGIALALRQRAKLVATELATNLLRHAHGGNLLLRALPGGIEVISVDRGPGIASISSALADPDRASIERRIDEGKVAEGLGVGLASVRRMATVFDIWSKPDRGTVVLAQLFPNAETAGSFVLGGVAVPMRGDGANGDAWAEHRSGRVATLALVDGLGHGAEAARAAHAAIEAFERGPEAPLLDFISRAHTAMRSTRGGALAIARVDASARSLEFCGVGNVVGRILGAGGRRLITRVGTLGLAPAVPRARVERYDWPAGAALLLHTDGVREHFDSGPYDALTALHPALLAALVHRDHNRGRDDATVVVVKEQGT